MISKRIKGRTDGKSSANDALRYGEGLKVDRDTGELLDKSHRTRLGNFGLVDDGVYIDRSVEEMAELINLAALEMQSNCDQNTKVGPDKRMAHFVISFNQERPGEAVLRDTEDSMLAAMELERNHFASFLHNDNGYWHLHLFASRISKEKPYRGNPLWQDRIKRDRVCREIEARHNMAVDRGLHQRNERGEIVEIPRADRRLKREEKTVTVSDKAKTTQAFSGEKSFQAWCLEMRLGDRLKHAQSWKDLHAAAAAYGCEVKPKGAGFVVCPIDQKGSIQLSKIGLKNLPLKFGAFVERQSTANVPAVSQYSPSPTVEGAGAHYTDWQQAKGAFKTVRTERTNELRVNHAKRRQEAHTEQKLALATIRRDSSGPNRFAAVSVVKMQFAVAQTQLKEQFAAERQSLRKELAGVAPGSTFRDFLTRQATRGDDAALSFVQSFGTQEATEVLRQREVEQLKIVAAVSGQASRPAPRLNFAHQVQRNGTVVYDFGLGRKVTDSSIARQVQLNAAAAESPETIGTALAFAASRFGQTLTLTGSAQFQRLAVETAVLQRLAVKFEDPGLEAYRLKCEAQQRTTKPDRLVPDFSHLTPNQIDLGIKHFLSNTLDGGRPPAHVLRAEQHRRRIAAQPVKPDLPHQVEPVPSPATVPLTAAEWIAKQTKPAGQAYQVGDNSTRFTVVHIADDGVVLNHGRSLAIYPVPAGSVLQADDQVVIGRNLELRLPVPEQGHEGPDIGR